MAKNKNQVSFDVQGLKEILTSLKTLDEDIREKTLKKGLRRVSKLIEAKAKALAPKGRIPGKKTISGSFTTSTKKGRTMLFGVVRNKAPHAHLLEYGHWLVKGKFFQKRIRWVDSVPPHGYMRGALSSTSQPAMNEFKTNLEQSLARLARKRARGA